MLSAKSMVAGLTLFAATQFVVPSVQAGVVTGSPIGHILNNATIALSPGTPTFDADLTTYSSFAAQLHDLVGAGPGYPNDADVEFQDATGPDGVHGDIRLPYAMVGRHANGESGGFVWKFTMAPGYQTGAGAQIDYHAYFRHDPASPHGASASIAIYDSLVIYSDNSGVSPSGSNVLAKKTAQDIYGPGNHGYDTYRTDGAGVGGAIGAAETLAIPAGLTSFFVVFEDQDSFSSVQTFSSARWALTGMSVNAAPVLVPEPASLAAMASAGLLALKRRR